MLAVSVPRTGAESLVFGLSVGAFVVGELQQALRVRARGPNSQLVSEVLFRAMFLGGILMVPLGSAVCPGADIGGPTTFVVGVVVGWMGLLLRWLSFATLGRYFTLVLRASADQPVVDHGPYRVLRHPSYTGLLLALLGCGLMLGNWVGAAGSVALVLVALLVRIRAEERALTAALGDRYRDFAAGRARLVPFIW